MKNWNERYATEKTAFDWSPIPPLVNSVAHLGLEGLKGIGHGIAEVARGVGHGINQLGHDMLHPFTDKFQGDKSKLDAYKEIVDQSMKNLNNPNATPGSAPNGQEIMNAVNNYGDYLRNNTHRHWNLLGVGADAAAAGIGAAGAGVGKILHDTNQRSKAFRAGIIQHRQKTWGALSPEVQQQLVQMRGPEVDPSHPGHDPLWHYGVYTHPIVRYPTSNYYSPRDFN